MLKTGGAMATLVAIAVPWTGGVAQASGLEPGVHADPGSPAAKEYALPLNKARQIGASGSSNGDSAATLFGAGIAPPGTGGSGGGRAAPGAPSPRRGGHGAVRSAGSSKLASAVLASSLRSTGGGGSSLLALLAGGVLVLAIGALGGSVLRQTKVRRVTERK